MSRYLASLSLFLAGLVPFSVAALGLGEIDLKSGLNQPFEAEIGVTSESASDLGELQVSLASTETFNQFGLDRPAFLADFEFVVVSAGVGTTIEITSAQPVVEPFVTLLLEIKWPQGRLLREYTVLLDPPAFAVADVEPAIQEPVAGPAPVAEQTGIVRAPQPRQASPATRASAPVAAPASARPVPDASAPVAARQADMASSAPAATLPAEDGTYGPVARNDTLWGIAGRVSTDRSVGRNQIMLAIYRANPGAFAGNINRLKAGVILRVPEAEEFGRLGRREAMQEVQRQDAEWKADDTGRLRLVAPREPGSRELSAAQTGAGTTDAQVATAEQRALQQRVEELELELSDSQRLLELRDQDLQALQAQLAAIEEAREGAVAEADAEEPAAEEAVADPFAAEEAEEEFASDGAGIFAEFTEEPEFAEEAAPLPVTEPEPIPSAVVTTSGAPQSSFVGALFTNIWLYVTIGVVLVLAWVFVRRRAAGPAIDTWDDLGADDTDLEAGAPEAAGEFTAGVPEEATFIVEEAPSEPTIQEETQSEFEPAGSEQKVADEPEGEPAADQADAGADEDLLGDDLLLDNADAFADAGLPEADSEPAGEAEAEAVDVPHETAFERTISIAGGANLDQADPLAEADFHMAYGLYDQAADLLTEEISEAPDRKDLRLKLLEVYFIWENAEGFFKEAQEVKAYLSGDEDPDWNKVLIMGKQICPDESLFSAAPASAGQASEMDLVFDEEGQAAETYDVDVSFEEGADGDLDVSLDDLGGGPDLDLDVADLGEADAGVLDFDLGADDLEADELASTMETPTIESPALEEDSDGLASTMETPTIDIATLEPDAELDEDAAASGASTMETPTVDMPAIEPTMQTPTLSMETPLGDLDATGSGLPTGEPEASEEDPMTKSLTDLAAETLEVELDDTNIRGAGEAIGADDGLFSARDSFTDEEDDDIFLDLDPTEVLKKDDQEGLDDTVEQPGTDDTAEQPELAGDTDTFRALEISEGAAGRESGMEASTMTEVGTKLDLARAYIDMGDPEGARSILNEVLEEAGDSQRQEAQQLLAGLG